MSDANRYKVRWTQTALTSLGKLYNVDPDMVFLRSQTLLSRSPRRHADGIANFPGYKYNGYYWLLINNVVVIYSILEQDMIVRVRACYFANTEQSHEIF